MLRCSLVRPDIMLIMAFYLYCVFAYRNWQFKFVTWRASRRRAHDKLRAFPLLHPLSLTTNRSYSEVASLNPDCKDVNALISQTVSLAKKASEQRSPLPAIEIIVRVCAGL